MGLESLFLFTSAGLKGKLQGLEKKRNIFNEFEKEFCEWPILNYSRDKFSRKREKFIYLAKVNPINVA